MLTKIGVSACRHVCRECLHQRRLKALLIFVNGVFFEAKRCWCSNSREDPVELKTPMPVESHFQVFYGGLSRPLHPNQMLNNGRYHCFEWSIRTSTARGCRGLFYCEMLIFQCSCLQVDMQLPHAVFTDSSVTNIFVARPQDSIHLRSFDVQFGLWKGQVAMEPKGGHPD